MEIRADGDDLVRLGLAGRHRPLYRGAPRGSGAPALRGDRAMTVPYRTHAFDAGIAPLDIVIIGGGIGGLCLAQGLKKAGMSVAVYERERTIADRLQGYRV